MTYKETVLFIGKCLTINQEKQNRILIEKELQKQQIDWDNVVKVSTGQFVFPALYCNLKKADFLKYLPEDLVEYMKHIADLNRERNEQIIAEAKEINSLLLENNITPIFLKGTGNLLEGLYEDIAERMVGDIDFIVSYTNYTKAAKILLEHKYEKVVKKDYSYPQFKHFDRLFKKDKIAAVEVHKELTLEGYHQEFNYKVISENTINIDEINVMNYPNQLSLSIIASQINDDGQYYKNISLRNAYDVFLLSQKTNSLKAIESYRILFAPLNNFLAICKFALQSDKISYKQNKEAGEVILFFNKLLENKKFREKNHKRLKRKLAMKKRLNFVFQAFSRKENRSWIYHRVRDKEWQNEKLIQLGIRKPKPNL